MTQHTLFRPDSDEHLRVLHLEDSELDQELVGMTLLADLPWQPEMRAVASRDEFVAALEDFQPHIILSDYALPGYDGMSAFADAQARLPQVPFIIITGAMGEETAVDTLRQGVTDYILKARLERVAPAVRRALAEADAREQRERAEQAVRQLNADLRARLEEVERLRDLAEGQSKRLEVQAEQLEEALNMQKTFLMETSHELRTPLTAMHGYLRRIGREFGESQSLQDAQRIAENMTRLVNDLLQLSRGELVQSIEHHFLNLGRVMCQVGRDYHVKAECPDLEIVGDPGRLNQVFVNLVSNAVRVCGGTEYVELALHAEGERAVARVIDHGPGIPDHIKPRIFDKFYRGKEAGSAGLGLTIAQQVVTAHGGTIHVEDTPGGGATFVVNLPLAIEDEEDDEFELTPMMLEGIEPIEQKG